MENPTKSQTLPAGPNQAPVKSNWLFSPEDYDFFDSPEPIHIQPTPKSEMDDFARGFDCGFDPAIFRMEPPSFERLSEVPGLRRVPPDLPPPSFYDDLGFSPTLPTVPAPRSWGCVEPQTYLSDPLQSVRPYTDHYPPQPPASASRWISHYPLPSSGSQYGSFPPVDYTSGASATFKEGYSAVSTAPYTTSNSRLYTPSWNPYRSETPNSYAYTSNRSVTPTPYAYSSNRSVTPNPYAYSSNRSVTPNPYAYPSYSSSIPSAYTYPSYTPNPYAHPSSALNTYTPPIPQPPISVPYPTVDEYDPSLLNYADNFAQNVPSAPLYSPYYSNQLDYKLNEKAEYVPPQYCRCETPPPVPPPAPIQYEPLYSPILSTNNAGLNMPAGAPVTNLSKRNRLVRETKKKWLKDLFRTTVGYGVFSLGITMFWLGLLYLYDSDVQYKKMVEQREALFAGSGCNFTAAVSTADDSQSAMTFLSQGCENITASLVDPVPQFYASARPYIELFSMVAGYTILVLIISTWRTARNVVRCVKQGNAFIDRYLSLRPGRKAEAARKKNEKASRTIYANSMFPKQFSCGCISCGSGKTYLVTLADCRCRYSCALCYQSLSDAMESWDNTPAESSGTTRKFYETVKPSSTFEWVQKAFSVVFNLHLPCILLIVAYYPILTQGPAPGKYLNYACNMFLALFFLRSVAKFTRQLIGHGEKNEFVEGTG
ncbi:hypothetical protein D9757_011054 [Collybiopsis confluens]|uniref:Uncharacterized protein n=1 Tax=Collybiopsis confluens TaxID=2823264 RepID=A0A8H5GJK1_9AGAR|nr:hypothetical protein D9757_011054 [Collybiopsis confluens]